MRSLRTTSAPRMEMMVLRQITGDPLGEDRGKGTLTPLRRGIRSTLMQPEDILVIGAGPAGLAASACMRREGLEHVLLEREATVAPAWHRHYDRLHLHTTRTYSGLPMMPWPKATPRYPSREQVVQYFRACRIKTAALARGEDNGCETGQSHGRRSFKLHRLAHDRDPPSSHGCSDLPSLIMLTVRPER